MNSQQFCVRWNSYPTNLQNVFPQLLSNEHFVDVTLACEGQSVKCHKMVLSACSAYFENLLVQNPCQHPIIIMKDLKIWEVKALVEFMYKGEVNVPQDKLSFLLKAAESLQVKGLSGPDQNATTQQQHSSATSTTLPSSLTNSSMLSDQTLQHIKVTDSNDSILSDMPPPKRRRGRPTLAEKGVFGPQVPFQTASNDVAFPRIHEVTSAVTNSKQKSSPTSTTAVNQNSDTSTSELGSLGTNKIKSIKEEVFTVDENLEDHDDDQDDYDTSMQESSEADNNIVGEEVSAPDLLEQPGPSGAPTGLAGLDDASQEAGLSRPERSVLMSPGPFITARYLRRYSCHFRFATPGFLETIFQRLTSRGFGSSMSIDRTFIFYKKPFSLLSPAALKLLDKDADRYRDQFSKVNPDYTPNHAESLSLMNPYSWVRVYEKDSGQA